MAAMLLEDVSPGTLVRDGTGTPVGEVRALYAAGDSRQVEFVLVYWNQRASQALVAADEVASVDANGVTLIGGASLYEDLAGFNPADNPQLHQL